MTDAPTAPAASVLTKAAVPPPATPGAPWHAGERQLQAHVGTLEKMAQDGKKLIRDHMTEQHQRFYADSPFLLVGAVDAADRPWATVLTGAPGFAHAPDPKSLRIDARPAAEDPAAAGLAAGAPIGLLGIMPHNRRRNRMNGRLAAVDAGGLSVGVAQSFGNCPQYIQTRTLAPAEDAPAPGPVEISDALTAAARAMIEAAESFYVASYVDEDGDRQVDVSHRGGKRGFVRIGADGALTIPDFAGNLFFNTLGNILLTGKAGLAFVDFDTGDLLQLTGRAEVILDSPEIAAFQGAERLWRVIPEQLVRRPGAVPLRGAIEEWSPNSLMTGSWEDAAGRLAADARRDAWRPMRVERIVEEAAGIRSFTLTPADGDGLARFEAGQHLPIRVAAGAEDASLRRTYTLSSTPSDAAYRISVKRDGAVSNWLHDHLRDGDLIEAQAPRGGFTVDAHEQRPLVLLSGGIGITPMLSMLRHVVYEGRRTRRTRKTWFIHGARTAAERPFQTEIAELVAAGGDAVQAISALSAPEAGLTLGQDYDHAGRVDLELLKRVLPFDDFDFYLCGPGPFMQAMYDALRDVGVRDSRIFAEAFGPSALARRPDDAAPAGPSPAETPVPVLFSASTKEARWSPGDGSLLELAEARGLSPEFSCRSGACGACKTRVIEGAVAYTSTPSAPVGPDEALICCSAPAAGTERLVLDV